MHRAVFMARKDFFATILWREREVKGRGVVVCEVGKELRVPDERRRFGKPTIGVLHWDDVHAMSSFVCELVSSPCKRSLKTVKP